MQNHTQQQLSPIPPQPNEMPTTPELQPDFWQQSHQQQWLQHNAMSSVSGGAFYIPEPTAIIYEASPCEMCHLTEDQQ